MSAQHFFKPEQLALAIILLSGGGNITLADSLVGGSSANLSKATLSSVTPVSANMLSAMRQLDSANSYTLHQQGNATRAVGAVGENGKIWVEGYGHGGKLDRDVEPMQHFTNGLLLGTHWRVDEEWHLGLMGGTSQTRMDSSELDGHLDSWHLGAYALRQNGPMSLRLGAAWSSHAGSTKRQPEFPDNSNQIKGAYEASTQQAFGEVGYNLGRANISIEPFASLGYQRYQRAGYTEKGAATALRIQDQIQSNMNSTFGLRLAKIGTLENGMRLTPRFSASWKHLYGDIYSKTRQGPATGNREYTIYGIGLDRDSLVLSTGLDLGISTHHTLGVGLTGEIGTDSRSHGVSGQWRMAF